MPETREVEFGVLNVTAQPHRDGIYPNLLKRVSRSPRQFWGQEYAAISAPERVEGGIYLGIIHIWTEIDPDSPAVNTQTLQEVTLDEAGIIVPEGLPNLLGFTVAGMAVFLAFSHPETMEAITEEGEPRSYFVTTMAAFFHFILVQSVALLLGVVGQYFSNVILACVGTLVLVYAILVGLAMGMQLLHTSRIINAAFSLPKKPKDQGGDHVGR